MQSVALGIRGLSIAEALRFEGDFTGSYRMGLPFDTPLQTARLENVTARRIQTIGGGWVGLIKWYNMPTIGLLGELEALSYLSLSRASHCCQSVTVHRTH